MASIVFRPPAASDAASLWRLAPQFGGPDHDSCYSYLLLCTHFADTGVVAAAAGTVVGFALGYRPPMFASQLFVWHFGIAAGQRGSGLEVRLLEELLARRACNGVEFLCMTRALGDVELEAILRDLARRRSVGVRESPCFPGALFAEPHPDENLVRIGPLSGS